MGEKRAIGYVYVGNQEPTVHSYLVKQKLKKLSAAFLQVNIEDAEIYLDEEQAGPDVHRYELQKIMDMLRDDTVALIAAISIFDFSEDFLESIDILRKFGERNVRIILIDQNLDVIKNKSR